MKKEILVIKFPHYEWDQMTEDLRKELIKYLNDFFGGEIKILWMVTDEVEYTSLELLRGEYSEEEITTKEEEIRKLCQEYIKPQEEILDDEKEGDFNVLFRHIILG